jgi:hypothetical protein
MEWVYLWKYILTREEELMRYQFGQYASFKPFLRTKKLDWHVGHGQHSGLRPKFELTTALLTNILRP